jgi:hypothetical protein
MNAIATSTVTEPTPMVQDVPAPVTDRTIHNETNFHPEEYEVLEYLDNRPPKWEMFCPPISMAGDRTVLEAEYAAARQQFNIAQAEWAAQLDRYFPHRREEQPSIHKCTHCGNTQVRYIVAVKHKPTGQNVVFGDVCVARLNFANHQEFKAAQVRARAAQGHAILKVYAARVKFLNDHQALKLVIENAAEINHPDHARNSFAKDILSKFNKYGFLSEPQVNAFLTSLERDHEYAARRAAQQTEVRGPVPTGRQVLEGEVVSIKEKRESDGQGGDYPTGQWKMTVKLANNSCVWVTVPSDYDRQQYPKGSRVKLRATVIVSRTDQSFGFGKRPHLISVTAPQVAQPTAVVQ